MPRRTDDVNTTVESILAKIRHNSDSIFHRLRLASGRLGDYAFLVGELSTRNVSTDPYYQKLYTRFFVVRRNASWRSVYYKILQSRKNSKNITFSEVLSKLHSLTQRVEPSFSSKLVAVIRPELPTYDSKVCDHMDVSVPPYYLPAEERIRRLAEEYARMTKITLLALTNSAFDGLRRRFDREFPPYKRFTNSKKLDLMLWQCR